MVVHPRTALFLAAFIAPIACKSERTSPAPPASAASLPGPHASAAPPERSAPAKPPEPVELLSLSSSAYQASLSADADAAYLLTSGAAYRVAHGRAAEALRVELGFGATATARALVFWSDGAVRELSKGDGELRALAKLASRPQVLVASGSDAGWIERSPSGRYALGSSASKTSSVYVSPGKLDALAMLSDWLFFVERPSEREWRIGGVRASGGATVFTSSRPGRAPAMLVAHHDLYYYDGNRHEVRRLTPDLRSEETLATDFVCSPLAVAERVHCANVEGIFELVPGSRPRPLVGLAKHRLVTDLAANGTHLYWVSDAGPDKLAVYALPLAELGRAP